MLDQTPEVFLVCEQSSVFKFNVICSVPCDCSHPDTPKNAHSSYQVTNHPHTCAVLHVSAFGFIFFCNSVSLKMAFLLLIHVGELMCVWMICDLT